MRVLLWHVHGSWATAFVQGRHDYVVPVTPGRDADGLGRADSWDWPASVRELPPEALRDEPFDVVLLQRPHELALATDWLGGRVPGRDVPAVFVEHNTPKGDVPNLRHPMADQAAVPIVHVTPFNAVFWDNGRAPVHVVEHGVLDPGDRYTGELESVAVAVNEPVRRGRVVGADLLAPLSAAAPLDVFGMRLDGLHETWGTDPRRVRLQPPASQAELHAAMARRRAYLHPVRWTSLGLSLLEAMTLGMPVVVLATTEAVEAVPAEAGCVSTDPRRLATALRELLADPERARLAGKAARAAALERYGLDRFLTDWDRLLEEVQR